jgi:hypothetical protein
MTDAQLAALFCAAPFLLLTACWLVGLTVLAIIGDE